MFVFHSNTFTCNPNYLLLQQNIINDFEMNELYNQCKKTLPKQTKENLEEKKKK